ncbi:MAG: hypothetical protein Q4D91_08395 [Lautropia sp.]|nr:hypothetical protein [Lautropia sp.]
MKKKLLSLMMLTALAACGGGGGGGGGTPAPAGDNTGGVNNTSNTNTPTTPNGNDSAPSPADDKAAIQARLDACPSLISNNAVGAAACLAGIYAGIDAFTKESCTVKIEANGNTEATRGNLRLQLQPNIAPSYSKVTHSGPGNYNLIWAVIGKQADGMSAKVFLNYNQNLDKNLKIEVSNTDEAIHCHLQL